MSSPTPHRLIKRKVSLTATHSPAVLFITTTGHAHNYPRMKMQQQLDSTSVPEAATQCPITNVKTFTVAENICRVITNRWINAEYMHLALEAPIVALTAQPGQFFHIACPPCGNESSYLRRPMSVYRVNREASRLEFLYKVQGIGTRGLATLEPGGTLNVMGPLGQGFSLPAQARHILILARGVGLATMASLAELANHEGAKVTAVLSARSEDLLMSVEYLKSVGARVLTVNDLDGSSSVDRLESLLRKLNAEQTFDHISTCGSNRLLQLTQRMAAEWSIPGEVALEQKMGCALGMCFACVKPFRKGPNSELTSYRRVCWDGPVFNVQEAVSW